MPRFWLRLAAVISVPIVLLAALWIWRTRQPIAWQWAGYRVGTASSFEEAAQRINQIDQQPNRRQKLRRLVQHWGTGNSQFDLYLARYVSDPVSSESLRREFSRELAWRGPLLARWTHYWCWRAPQEPNREIAGLVEYFDVLASAEPVRSITWREVLDLQAVLQLAGRSDLAERLSPDNWHERYRQWQSTRSELPTATRPAEPLPVASSES